MLEMDNMIHDETQNVSGVSCDTFQVSKILKNKMAYQSFQAEYMQMPTVTRAYTTACVLTTLAVVSVILEVLVCAIKPIQSCIYV